jgi:hypothetical protein
VALWSRMHCWSSAPVNPTHWEREDVPPLELLSLALPGDEVSLVDGMPAAELPPDALPPDELSPVALPLVAPPPTESLLELPPALGLVLSPVLPP